jgi:pre-mRNA-splicing factor SYF1
MKVKIHTSYFQVIGCPFENPGIVEALIENNVLASFSGHDHKNDFGGIYKNKKGKSIELAYGRKTGYGGYSPVDYAHRGARIIIINKNQYVK